MEDQINEEWGESVNDVRREEGEEPITLSQALVEFFDPYTAIVRDSMDVISQAQRDREAEYAD